MTKSKNLLLQTLILAVFLSIQSTPAQAIPTGTGGENFPLDPDSGDDFNHVPINWSCIFQKND